MDILRIQSQGEINEDLVLLRQMYPNLSRDQLLEAKENLDRYFEVAVRIFLRLEAAQSPTLLDPTSQNS